MGVHGPHMQDNESLQARVSQAVTEAVLGAGRAHPGADDIHLDIDAVIDGMCDAIATFVASVALMPEDRERGVALLENAERGIVARLRFLGEKVSSGELDPPPSDRPKPRLVK